MSNLTRLFLTAVVLLLAAILVLWSGSPLRADMRGYVVVLALFMIVVMWAFPRVGIRAQSGEVGTRLPPDCGVDNHSGL